MRKVYLIPNMLKDQACQAAGKVVGYLLNNGYSVAIEDVLQQALAEHVVGATFVPHKMAIEECDIIIVVGGDGTLLHAAANAATHKKPILGINNGKLGFMTEIDLTQLHLLENLKINTYKTEDRMLLDVTVRGRGGKVTFKTTVLNDAVVTKGLYARLVDLQICVDGKNTVEFRGDGVIICTPTGSTGYSLSAGGPIVEPNASCIGVTPICPHALTVKSFILADDRVVTIPEKTEGQTRCLSVDGSDMIELNNGEVIEIKKSKKVLKMIRITDQGFYHRINEKLVREVPNEKA